jgi:hypothetical protein
MAQKEGSPLNFLEAREEYRRELHRLNQLQAKLMAIFDAKDAADLERHLLLIYGKRNHPASTMVELYNQQGVIFHRATVKLECSEILQRKRAKAQQEALAKDLASVEC